MRTAALCLAASAALLLPACSSTPTADGDATAQLTAGEPINTICPLGGHEVPAEGGPTTTYKGYTIGFCCEGCAEAWPEETAEARDEMLADLLANGG